MSAAAAEQDPMETVNAVLGPVLEVLGIEQVLNLDDEHSIAANDSAYDADHVVALLQTETLDLEALVKVPELFSILTDADGEIIGIDAALDRIRLGVNPDAEAKLTELSILAEMEDDTPGQVDAEDFVDVISRPALERIFQGHGYRAMTRAEWSAEGAALLKDPAPKLVLLDRDLSREGGTEDEGDRIAAEILSKADHVSCCLLTHSAASDGDESQLESEISERHGIKPGALVVLSKSRLTESPERFGARLLALLFRTHLQTIKSLLNNALEAGHAAATGLLETVSDFQLLSMFAAAVQEGVHEPDHMLRPLQAVARRAASEAVRPDDSTRETLTPLHQALDLNMSSTGLVRTELGQLQKAELIDPGDFLARTVQPVEPGDIFQIVDCDGVLAGEKPASKYHLILLAQPCDVMVRSKGRRGKNVPPYWVLARVTSYDARMQHRPEVVHLPTFHDGKPRTIRLAEIVHVPVIALDLCVFDPDGYSRMNPGDPAPSKASWSWTRRHEIVSERVRQILDDSRSAGIQDATPEARRLIAMALTGCLRPSDCAEQQDDCDEKSAEFDVQLSRQTVSAAIDVDNNRVAFGLRRVGRLNDGATRALLIQATHHQGRPAGEPALESDPVEPPETPAGRVE